MDISMLIAFISDIHGNLPALKAVIDDAKKRGADKIICCGDVTGNGPFPVKHVSTCKKTKFHHQWKLRY